MIYIVTGPPAAGKTTWAKSQAKPGDIVIDYDALAQVLSPNGLSLSPLAQPPHVRAVIRAARAAAIEAALERADRCVVYIIHARPDKSSLQSYRNKGAQIVTIDPGYSECLRRAIATRTPAQQKMVRDWYARKYSPASDMFVV